MRLLSLFLLAISACFGGGKILLVHDTPVHYWLEDIQKIMDAKDVLLVQSRLKENFKDPEIRYFVFWNKPDAANRRKLLKVPKAKALLFMWEPPTVQKSLFSRKYLRHFKRIYTWDDDLVDHKRFFKLYYPSLKPMATDLPSFTEKKLCSFVFSHKKSTHPHELYSEREKTLQFFEQKPTGEFEFYGRGWEALGYKNYRGAPEDKFGVLKNYRFSICYENMSHAKGYITEKIFDCFAAGTVPIYWGASNIQDYIPENCYIDRRKFKDHDELYAFLKNIDEQTYNQYLDNIRAFLQSDQAQLFSKNMFTTIFLEATRLP